VDDASAASRELHSGAGRGAVGSESGRRLKCARASGRRPWRRSAEAASARVTGRSGSRAARARDSAARKEGRGRATDARCVWKVCGLKAGAAAAGEGEGGGRRGRAETERGSAAVARQGRKVEGRGAIVAALQQARRTRSLYTTAPAPPGPPTYLKSV
jgi:hypothetical protein